MSTSNLSEHPHKDQPIKTGGSEADSAELFIIMLHGRGSNPEDMLGLAGHLHQEKVRFLAPQAYNFTWYPYPFTYPVSHNEPHLSSALAKVDEMVEDLISGGTDSRRIMIMGFSQGACLATEYVARNPRPYGGVAGLSGGLIGPEIEEERYKGSLSNTPVFLGCSNIDPHIPEQRVHDTERILTWLDAEVSTQIYPGMGHMVNEDEIDHVNEIIAKALGKNSA